jgi:4-hydroxybutyryl-CoA dehydratase/vinylacetyl-CoA-Delta-isomerase
MAIKTGAEYVDDLRSMTPNVYMLGEKVKRVWDDPRFQSTLNIISKLHDFSFDEEFRELSVVHEPLVGEPVRRLNLYIQRTMEDSIIKVRLTREVTQRRICTWCMCNILGLLWATTYETDALHKTEYHSRFVEFAKHLMKNDYDCVWGMMDPKGDRSLRPSQQKHLTGLKVTKRDAKGITVSGCKVHTSYCFCAKYIVVVPCRALTEEDKDFAVAFAVPVDTQGITFIARPAPQRSNPEGDMECPIGSAIGAVEGTTFFEDVFVPWERVFMCGEWEMAERIPYFFGNLQRQSKCACLAGHTDLVCGVAALVADVNGLGMKTTHIRDKITHTMIQAEVAQGCALGAAAGGEMHPSGVFIPSTITANAGLNYIKNLAGEHIQLLHDIAGGIIVTMPTENDYRNPKLKALIDTYLSGNAKYTTEERLRVLYLAQEIAASTFTGYFLGWAINASGSPMTGDVLVRELYDLKKRVDIAKGWAKI